MSETTSWDSGIPPGWGIVCDRGKGCKVAPIPLEWIIGPVEKVPFDSIQYQDPVKLAEAINKIGLYGHRQELLRQITDRGEKFEELSAEHGDHVFNIEFARRHKAQKALDAGFDAFLSAVGYTKQEDVDVPDELTFAWSDLFDHFYGDDKQNARHEYEAFLSNLPKGRLDEEVGSISVHAQAVAIPVLAEHDAGMSSEAQPETGLFQPPQEVAEQLEARRLEYEKRWDELDHAGMPQAAKLETLYREFPEFIPPEEIERRVVAEIAHARNSKPPRKRSAGRSSSRSWVISDAGPRVKEEMDRIEGRSDPSSEPKEQLVL